jgi:glycosyltransferase involved in cell wall biosynthesis
MPKRVLILANSSTPSDVYHQIAHDTMPRIDYLDLRDRLHADLIDHTIYRHRLYNAIEPVERAMRLDWGLAAYAICHWHGYDAVLTLSEDVGLPLAFLLRLLRRPVRHVMVVHSILSARKKLMVKMLNVLGGIDAVVSLTQATARQVIQTYHLSPTQVMTVIDGADERFWRPQPHIQPDPRLALSIGQARRDYSTLLQAIAGLPLRLHLHASSQWYIQYKTKMGEPPANITFGNFLPYPCMRDLYSSAGFVVVPLQPDAHHSAGSATIKESMAMGKAVIVSSTGGAEDYVEHGKSGLIVPPGDVQALRQAIEMLVQNPGLAQEMGRYARQIVERRMTHEHKIAPLAQLVFAETKSVIGDFRFLILD